jgi:probable phosphoglycerate mutase
MTAGLGARPAIQLPTGLTLYFARHGQTEANVQKRFSGYKDTPITPLGLEQAAEVGRILKRELGGASGYQFISSPLARAVATMKIARQAMGLPAEGFTTDNRLKEINLGVWDQLTDEEARALSPILFEQRGNDKWHVRVPGGENYAEVAARITDWVRELKADTIAISHGATTRILRGLLAGLDWREMSSLDEPQGVVFRVTGGQVVRLDPQI